MHDIHESRKPRQLFLFKAPCREPSCLCGACKCCTARTRRHRYVARKLAGLIKPKPDDVALEARLEAKFKSAGWD